MTIVERDRAVTGGVDTHLDVHVAAALDPVGGLLGVESFEVNARGYRALLQWMGSFGALHKVGVEGTGAYGAGLGPLPAEDGDRRRRGRSAQSPGPAPEWQVRPRRRRRSGPRRPVGTGSGHTQDQRRYASRPSGPWSWPSARPAGRASPRCARCAS